MSAEHQTEIQPHNKKTEVGCTLNIRLKHTITTVSKENCQGGKKRNPLV